MPGTVSDGPSVALSFANNFWGKDDAGVEPLLQRMLNAKQTSDELKSFYTGIYYQASLLPGLGHIADRNFEARAAIEEEYARKLLSLSRKPLGSQETGTLRASLDVLRGEVEQMGKSHQNIAGQMKTELEEPLAAFAGAMKERRKIVQNGIEKLLKVKVAQTQLVNKVSSKPLNPSGIAHSTPDPGQIRTRVPKNKGLSGTGTHGHGARGAEEQG
jgi:hypothetical protein